MSLNTIFTAYADSEVLLMPKDAADLEIKCSWSLTASFCPKILLTTNTSLSPQNVADLKHISNTKNGADPKGPILPQNAADPKHLFKAKKK